MNYEIEKLKSTVTGEKPSLILIDKKDVDQQLGNAFKNVLDKACDSHKTKNLVVLYEGDYFNSNEIRKKLKTITTKNVNVFDPENLDEQTCEKNLMHFLSNENQILVVEQSLFTGCESPHIICLVDDDSANDSMRCALLRAVSHLTLILAINNDSSYYFNLNGLTIQSKYLKCATQANHTFHCESCNIPNVCKSCLLFCHNQHQIQKKLNYYSNIYYRCECNQSKRCKIS
jgi:hypothetical protein